MRISAIALVLILISGCAELDRTAYSQSLETEAKPFSRILSFTKPYVIVPIPLDEAVLRITLHNAVTSVSFLFVGLVLPIPLPTEASDSNVFHIHISASPNTDSISINHFNVVLHIHNRKASPSIVTMSAPFQGEVSAEKATILITETTHLDLFFPMPQSPTTRLPSAFLNSRTNEEVNHHSVSPFVLSLRPRVDASRLLACTVHEGNGRAV